jgi:hypothetical protein
MAKTVTVANKMSSGLMLQLRQEHEDPKLRTVLREVAIKGSRSTIEPFIQENGVGLTEVDADFWEAWEAWAVQNSFEPYMRGMIFCATSLASVKAEAKEKANEMSGFEGLKPLPNEGERTALDPRLAEFSLSGLQGEV